MDARGRQHLARLSPLEVVELAGISAEELERYKRPAAFEDQGGAVPQPPLDGPGPHMSDFPPGAYEAIMSTPDAVMWGFVESEPPVKTGAA